MATIEVVNWDKKKVGTVDVPSDVVEGKVRKDVLHTIVKWQLAKKRQGTHKAKTRGEVSGTGKKPYKQKGTGNARRGSEKSPLIASGGGVTFAPRPRDYEFKLTKKLKQMGLRSALSYLNQEGRLFVVEDMKSEGKTKEAATRLKSFGLDKAVLIDSEINDSFQRATNNLKPYIYYSTEGLNVYDLLKYDAVVMTKSSIESVSKRCGVES